MIDRIKSVTARKTGWLAETLHPETRFDDLGTDSLDIICIEQAIEDEFGTEIPDGFLADHPTIGDAAAAVERLARRKEAA